MNIKKYRKEMADNGFNYLPKFFNKNKNFKRLSNVINNFIFDITKKNNINLIDKSIIDIFKKNKNISAYINDNLNLLPSLHALFADKNLLNFVSKFLNIKKIDLISNNPRLRVQIPGMDQIANLPWHQDSHYNKIKSNKSVVVWISLKDITLDMGPVLMKKKSHKLGETKIKFFKKPNGVQVPSVDMNKLGNKFQNVIQPTKKGDALLFDINLVHRSGYNKSTNKIKLSAQIRFHQRKKFIKN